MPPNDGMAMGTMMSAPRPVLVSTGSSARMVVALVMTAARMRRWPPSTTALRIASIESGFSSAIDCSMRVAMMTPSSVAIPKSARNPTQTATLRLYGSIWKRPRRLVPSSVVSRNHGWA